MLFLSPWPEFLFLWSVYTGYKVPTKLKCGEQMGTNNVAQILVPAHTETSSNSSETYSLELIYKKSM